MTIERVVLNASPLIALFTSQQAELLPQLFTEIVIPDAVWKEITVAGKADLTSEQLPTIPWVRRVEIAAVNPAIAAWDLGVGESEVLSFALETPGYRAMVDDRAARQCARTLGISTLGTGGALVLAKKRGLIPTLSTAIQALRDAGLWLSDDLVVLLKQEAGEDA